jgi:hypothetical protein
MSTVREHFVRHELPGLSAHMEIAAIAGAIGA